MKLFEFTYNECQAFIDVDEVIQVYANGNQSDAAVCILYKNGAEKTFFFKSGYKQKFCEDILNFKQAKSRQYD